MPRVSIGKIRAPHGIAGEVKVETWDPTSKAIQKGTPLFLEKEAAPRIVKSVRPQRDWILVALEGVTTRNDSERLVGREISIERDALPKLSNGEFYINDVIGYSVVLGDGTKVGALEGSAEGAQLILVVKGPTGREILIPCVEGIVVEIRNDAREILVDPPDGLLELYAADTATAADADSDSDTDTDTDADADA